MGARDEDDARSTTPVAGRRYGGEEGNNFSGASIKVQSGNLHFTLYITQLSLLKPN